MILFILFLIIFVSSITKIQLSSSIQIQLTAKQPLIIQPFSQIQTPIKFYIQTQHNHNKHTCTILNGQLNKTIINYFPLKINPNTLAGQKINLIYSLQQLHHEKYSIDMIQHNGYYYVVFNEGMIYKIQIINNSEINMIKTLKRQKGFSQGYFVQNKDYLLYVTGQDINFIQQQQIITINEYNNSGFINCRITSKNELLISLSQNGFNIYLINKNRTISLVSNYNKKFFTQPVQIIDIYIDQQHQLLLLLDRYSGIIFYNYYSSTNITLNTNLKFKYKNCLNFYYSFPFVYLTCPHLIKYHIFNNITQTKISYISPQYILIKGQSIYLSSNSHLQYYSNWNFDPVLTQIYDATAPYILQNGQFIYINDYVFMLDNLTVINPSLQCISQYQQKEQQIILYAYSKCNNTFIQQKSIIQNISIEQNDYCNYSQKIKIKQIWPQQKFNWYPIIIVGIFFFLMILSLIIWCCSKNVKLSRKYSQLQQVLNTVKTQNQINAGVDKKDDGTYNVFLEQKQTKGQNKVN